MKTYTTERRSVSLRRFLKSGLSALLIIAVLYGCNKDDEINPSGRFLVWQPSTISFPSDLSFSPRGFSKSDDGKLYVYGNAYDRSLNKNTTPLLVLRADNAWHTAADLEVTLPSKVQVVDNKIYFTSYEDFYQVASSGTEIIHSFDTGMYAYIRDEYINGMESFEGKLLMHGRMKINEKDASVFSYDGTSFSLISDNPWQTAFFRDGDDLFIMSGNDLYQYDGKNMTMVKENVSVIRIHNGEFYSLSHANEVRQIVKEGASGSIINLGDPFPENISIYQLLFLGDIPVAIGIDHDSQLSVTYFLENNEWISVPTIVQLNSVVEFNGRIMAEFYNSQKIIELVRQ